jgi:DNA-binding MarR family transcriptional regulator
MSETGDDNPLLLDRQLCFALYATSRAITKLYGGLLKEMGLTYPQYLVMLLLWEKDGLSVQQIADRLELEGATTTPLIQRMEKLGLLTRKRSQDDERRLEIHLTARGRALRDKALDVPPQLICTLDVTHDRAGSMIDELRAIRASIEIAVTPGDR